MDVIPGYWVCTCGNFNDDSLTWCLECVKERGEDCIPSLIVHEDTLEASTYVEDC